MTDEDLRKDAERYFNERPLGSTLIDMIAFALRRDREERDTLEAGLVRLGHRPIYLMHRLVYGKWKWELSIQEAHTCEWCAYDCADTPRAAVEAALREMDTGVGEERKEMETR